MQGAFERCPQKTLDIDKKAKSWHTLCISKFVAIFKGIHQTWTKNKLLISSSFYIYTRFHMNRIWHLSEWPKLIKVTTTTSGDNVLFSSLCIVFSCIVQDRERVDLEVLEIIVAKDEETMLWNGNFFFSLFILFIQSFLAKAFFV